MADYLAMLWAAWRVVLWVEMSVASMAVWTVDVTVALMVVLSVE